VVLFILFAGPLLAGVIGAAICICLRPCVPRWIALECLSCFLAAAGVGIGSTAAVMHSQGFRMDELQSVYDLPHREFMEAVSRKSPVTETAVRAQRKHLEAGEYGWVIRPAISSR
jgi:hypothetical protein